jgi:hypothetical protein
MGPPGTCLGIAPIAACAMHGRACGKSVNLLRLQELAASRREGWSDGVAAGVMRVGTSRIWPVRCVRVP